MLYSSIFTFIALTADIASSSAISYRNTQKRATYFSDNLPGGSSVIASQISDSDGTLSELVKTSTGGKGLDGLIAVSADSVVVSGNVWTLLYFSRYYIRI